MHTSPLARGRSTASLGVRTLFWLMLVTAEVLIVSYLFDFNSGLPDHLNPVFYVTRSGRWAAVSLPVFLILIWSEHQALAARWNAMAAAHDPTRPLLINVALFAALSAGCFAFSAYAATAATPPWHLLPFLGVLLAATGLSLIAIIAPLSGLIAIVWAWRVKVGIAAAVGLAIILLSEVVASMWQSMAWATLEMSAAILRLYETDVLVDTVDRGIRVGNFGVAIWDSCSGSEGLALVAGFVSVYLWAFRAELRFPHALILYPIGLAASWLLNSVRIAALISIGAHVSPDMAVKGFHSQAGWIAFLLVTLGLMSLTGRTGLITKRPKPAAPVRQISERYRQTVAHLLPFAALMMGTIAMSAAVPHDRPLYVLKALLVVGALWICRKSYGAWRIELSGVAVAAGLLIGAAWIVTAPATGSDDPLAIWLTEIGPALAALWIVVRGIGTIVLVPVAEELAFRGYLYRRILAHDFHEVSPTTLSWLALVLSSVLFGALHDRWLAGALAGVVFALVMVRRGRLGDAIVAHATANALIFAWALAAGDWSLL
jgi:exosortase E/protease (VPEID-CTERM system)